MQVVMPDNVFESLVQRFNSMDVSNVDPLIQGILARLQNSPVLNVIVPRWSCQSHLDDEHHNRDYKFYVIFGTRKNGDEVLKGLWRNITQYFIDNYGYGYMAGNCLSIIPLMIDGSAQYYEHLQLGTNTWGDPVYAEVCVQAWNYALDILEKEYNES